MTKKARVIIGQLKDIKTIPAIFDENNNETSPSYCLLTITTLNKKGEEENVEIKYSGLIYNLDKNKKKYLIDNQNNLLKIENNEPLFILCSKPVLFSIVFLKTILFMFFLVFLFSFSALITGYLSDGDEGYMGAVFLISLFPAFFDINDDLGIIIIISFLTFFFITYFLSLYRIWQQNKQGKIKIYNVKGISFIKKFYSVWDIIS